MNARRHTLDGDRMKLAIGILTYRQIGSSCSCGGKKKYIYISKINGCLRKWLVTSNHC